MRGKLLHFKRPLTWHDALIIVTNLVPVFGVWFLGWSGVEAFTVYAMETLILGVITVLKLIIATIFKRTDTWYNNEQTVQASGFLFIFFFIVHYGLFVAIQMSIFGECAGITKQGAGLLDFFLHWYRYLDKEIIIALCAFVISYIATSLIPFLQNRGYLKTPMMVLMFQPYGRIFIQQFIVIFGSMFLVFGLDKVFVLIFVTVKLWFDLYLNIDRMLQESMDKMSKDQPSKTK